MATRQRAQRGEDPKDFEGRVRKWKREWHTAGDTLKLKKLSFCKWTPTDERDLVAPGKRHPDIKPLPTPGGKPLPPLFMRPAVVAPRHPAPPVAPKMPAFKVKLSTSLAKQGSSAAMAGGNNNNNNNNGGGAGGGGGAGLSIMPPPAQP